MKARRMKEADLVANMTQRREMRTDKNRPLGGP
jgi:hypothetical protein